MWCQLLCIHSELRWPSLLINVISDLSVSLQRAEEGDSTKCKFRNDSSDWETSSFLVLLMNFFRISEAAQRRSLKVVVNKTLLEQTAALWWQTVTQQSLHESAVLPQGSGFSPYHHCVIVLLVSVSCSLSSEILRRVQSETHTSNHTSEQKAQLFTLFPRHPAEGTFFLWMDE